MKLMIKVVELITEMVRAMRKDVLISSKQDPMLVSEAYL